MLAGMQTCYRPGGRAARYPHPAHPSRPAHPASRVTFRARGVSWLGAGALLLAAGCARPAADGSLGAGTLLYVANAGDGTISRIDLATRRPAGRPLPAGAAPQEVVVATPDRVLVAANPWSRGDALTLLTRRAGEWGAAAVALEPGASDLRAGGDGRGRAAVAYRVVPVRQDPMIGMRAQDDRAPRCRLAVVDLATGRVGNPWTVCGGRDSVVAVAIGAAASPATDPTVYLVIRREPAAIEECTVPTGSRLVALDGRSGNQIAAAPLTGIPGSLLVAPPRGEAGDELFALTAAPAWGAFHPDECRQLGLEALYADAGQWDILVYDRLTLAPQRRVSLPAAPYRLAVTPEGDRAFALAGQRVLQIDLHGGAVHTVAALQFVPLGLALADDRAYVSDPFDASVHVLDTRSGRLLHSLPTGKNPLGVTLGAAPATAAR